MLLPSPCFTRRSHACRVLCLHCRNPAQEGSVASLVGVVPDPSTINDVPGLIVAFDGAAWLQQLAPPPSQQQQPGGRRQQGKAAPAAPAPAQPPQQLCYTASFQSVAHTSFCWALPLAQLGLALQAMPQLLANVRAELLGAAAEAPAGSR